MALELDNPWHCVYCQRKLKNPYLTESIDVMQTLFADDDKNQNMVTIKQELPDDYEEDEILMSQDDESIATTESEVDDSHFEANKVKSPVYKRRKVCTSVCGCWWIGSFFPHDSHVAPRSLCAPCCFNFHLVEFVLENDLDNLGYGAVY